MLVKLLEVPDCFDKVLYKQTDKSLIALTGTCKALRAYPRLRHNLNLRLMYDMDCREANATYHHAMEAVWAYTYLAEFIPPQQRTEKEARLLRLLRDAFKCEEKMLKMWGDAKVPYHGDAWKARVKDAIKNNIAKLETKLVLIPVTTHVANSTD